MEIRVATAEGFSLPIDCHVSIRIGDVLKQGKYEPARAYNFGQSDGPRSAKIDLFQHIGSCTVALDPRAKSNYDVSLKSLHSSLPEVKLKVSVASKSQKAMDERSKAVKNKAQTYLAKYRIEERLGDAVKAVLKEMPSDPLDFICRKLGGVKETRADPPAAKVDNVQTELPSQKPALNDRAAKELFRAFEDGSLSRCISDLKSTDAGPSPEAVHIREEELRIKARGLLLGAQADGSLEGILKGMDSSTIESRSPTIDPIGASSEGQTRPEIDEAVLREKAKSALLLALNNGDLDRLLMPDTSQAADKKTVLERPEDELRSRTYNALFAAFSDGSLQAAISACRTSAEEADSLPSEADKADNQNADRDALRLRVGNLLIASLNDGSLEAAVSAADE
eukprot:TRINITY_DN49779_c0_g1_i1.p1 TRINITY_DN49779_c0_g1~~TRINITY_DN49779_c0_g1_i1.p1  ORF type:complete len:395 (+),score=100.35 TRINITY_DN49779_c0_g1_i1:178-1362(+)